jgi:glucoamylase
MKNGRAGSNRLTGDEHVAPGSPGSKPTWSAGAKSGVGCAISSKSRIWFTIGRGIVNEVYHPWVDHAAIRDLGLIVTGPGGFFSEEQRDCASDTGTIEPGVPVYRVKNDCAQGRYQITKEIFADPNRDVLLQRVKFKPLNGSLSGYRLCVISSPRLGDQGADNCGWVGAFNGSDMLFARHQGHALALSASVPWLRRSVGYVGVSDAWQDLKRHGQMTWQYHRADHGHIALAGEIDLQSCGGEFVLALAIDRSPNAAALNAALALVGDFDEARSIYVNQWKAWQNNAKPLDDGEWAGLVSANAVQRRRPDSSRPLVNDPGSSDVDDPAANLYRTSMMVLRVHRSKQFAGASVASLAVPWGDARGDDDLGGYHLVWPRDMVEESCGFLAGGAFDEARSALNYLRVTQKPNGGWAQDMWLDGTPYASGVQLDEAALPILLVDLARREKAIGDAAVKSFWPMMRAAAGFIIRKGPSTGQSRWENTPGLSPYTLATEVAALVLTARMADHFGEPYLAGYFRETADLWNDSIEAWTYVTGTPLARQVGVDGYYIRVAPSPGMKALGERGEHPTLGTSRDMPNAEVVSPDALAPVRFGLRAADDPRIINTVKAVDAVNLADTPAGPCWRRYTGGYYGESDAGEPFTGAKTKTGHGRAWPLLTGERGHFELAAGNIDAARHMLATMGGLASQIGLLPEQVWDSDDIPKHNLYLGRPAGSAMPLAWAHSEYVRLLRSIRDQQVFDRPTDAYERYVERRAKTGLALWRFDHQPDSFSTGRRLRVELLGPAVVRFSTDGWHAEQELKTRDTGLGIHVVDLPTPDMNDDDVLRFTFRWLESSDRWEGKDFQIRAAGTRVAETVPGA